MMVVGLLVAAVVASWSPEAVVQEYILSNYPWPQVKVNTIYIDQVLPEAPPVEVSVLKGLPGTSTFILTFADGTRKQYIAQVEAFDKVLVSGRAISKGETVEPEDIQEAVINVKDIPVGAITDEEHIVGKAAKYAIPMNKAFTVKILESPEVIKRGQFVDIIYETNAVKMVLKGKAKEGGAIGQSIRVMNLSSKKYISATVVDGGTVSVNGQQ